MKGLSLCLIVLISNVLSPVAAYGKRGAAERLLAYYVYVAEGLAKQGYTIAPRCKGADKGRCNFDEFMTYIWEASGNDNRRPEIKVMEKYALDPMVSEFSKILDALIDYKTEKGFVITGRIDSNRLVHKSTGYYDALEKICTPVKSAQRHLSHMTRMQARPNDSIRSAYEEVIDKAKKASAMVVELRQQDMDDQTTTHSRINWLRDHLQDHLDKHLDIATKQGTDTAEVTGNYEIFDKLATVQTFEASLDSALTGWENANRKTKAHVEILEAAKKAFQDCNGRAWQ